MEFRHIRTNDYSPEDNRGYKYVLVEIDNFSKIGWKFRLKKENTQILNDSIEIILINSKRKPNLIETERGNEIYNNIFKFF